MFVPFFVLPEAPDCGRSSVFEQLDDSHEGVGIEPDSDAHTPSVGENDLDAAYGRLGLVGHNAHGEKRGLGLELVPPNEFSSLPVKHRLVDALRPAERPGGQTSALPTDHHQPPVRLSAATRFHHAGLGSPPFGHAAIVAWAARRGSPDAHELNTIRRAKRAWSSRKKPLSQATEGLLWKE